MKIREIYFRAAMSEKKKTGFEALAKSELYPQEELMKVKKSKILFFYRIAPRSFFAGKSNQPYARCSGVVSK
jgi:hypothetical protein